MNINSHKNIYIFETQVDLAKAAASLMMEVSKQAIQKSGRFVIALSGGSTPESLFKLLTIIPFKYQIQWEKTFVFWGDERFVPSDDERNNSNKAKTLLLNHVPIPSENIFAIPVDSNPKTSAEKYANTIKDLFGSEPPRFDLIFLGLGEDGHTASIFPESDLVFEKTQLVKEVYVEEQSMYRISMTPALINQAHHIAFLIEGENKAKILKRVLSEFIQPLQFPAQIIHPKDGNLYWYLDKSAAALLPANTDREN